MKHLPYPIFRDGNSAFAAIAFAYFEGFDKKRHGIGVIKTGLGNQSEIVERVRTHVRKTLFQSQFECFMRRIFGFIELIFTKKPAALALIWLILAASPLAAGAWKADTEGVFKTQTASKRKSFFIEKLQLNIHNAYFAKNTPKHVRTVHLI